MQAHPGAKRYGRPVDKAHVGAVGRSYFGLNFRGTEIVLGLFVKSLSTLTGLLSVKYGKRLMAFKAIPALCSKV